MGAVYRAFDRQSGVEVAVKRLLDVRHAARFEIEARLLASLSHPRVVKVIDHSSDDQGLYIVMDLVHGVDLGATLKRSGDPGLTIGDAVEYVRHGCEALSYVHSQQIVHRDVKPQNMILGEDGVVLVDFGVARTLGSEEQVTRARSRSARRATWRPRSSPAARSRPRATSSASPRRSGRC